MALPNPVAAVAARTFLPPVEVVRDEATLPLRCRHAQLLASAIAGEYNVNSSCMDMVYMSPSPYHDAFDCRFPGIPAWRRQTTMTRNHQ